MIRKSWEYDQSEKDIIIYDRLVEFEEEIVRKNERHFIKLIVKNEKERYREYYVN